MNKGLEALKEIAVQSVEAIIEKQEPLRTQKINEMLNTKQFKSIEKELKALEIIKEKKVNVVILMGCDSLEEYNKHSLTWHHLTQEEYNLLKEVLL